MQQLSAHADPPAFDAARKFVRVTQERADGLVAFEFSIGWPELSVELVLPRGAFDEFCAKHRVQLLEGPAAEQQAQGDDA